MNNQSTFEDFFHWRLSPARRTLRGRLSEMPDPTQIIIIATFGAAFGIFSIAAIARMCLARRSVHLIGPQAAFPLPGPLDSPYQAPAAVAEPPPLPIGRVPIWFYHPLDLLGIAAIFAMFFGLVIASLQMAEDADLVLDPAGLVASIGFQLFSAGIVATIVVPRVNPVIWLGLKWQGWRWVFLIAPVTVFAMWSFFGGLQAAGFMQWMETLGVEPVQDTVKLLQESKDPLVLGLMAFAAVIAAPLCEETVFRGYLYAAGKRFTGPWVSGICSALVFAAAHGSLVALLPLFVFGCLLAFIYEKTGSLWAPMAVHFCFNGATVVVQMVARMYDLPLDATT